MNDQSRIPSTIMAVLTRTVRRGFLICALCSLAIVASAWPATADQPIAVAIFDSFSKTAPGLFNGTFVAIIGTDVVRGMSMMDVKVVGDIAFCKFTYEASDGTLVLASVCDLSAKHGTWHVEEGTGRFKNFKAVGTQTFDIPPTFERFAGIGTFDKHGDDKHGDD